MSFYLIMTLCHYVSRITHERGNGCRPNIVGTDKARTREVINFWWWSGSACAFRITFSFFYHCAVCDFRRFISISHTITGRFLMKLGVTWLMPTREWIHNILFFFWWWWWWWWWWWLIRQTSESRSGLTGNPDSNPGWYFRVGGVCGLSLLLWLWLLLFVIWALSSYLYNEMLSSYCDLYEEQCARTGRGLDHYGACSA